MCDIQRSFQKSNKFLIILIFPLYQIYYLNIDYN